MKRVLCIWLPQWPLQRLAAARAELSACAVALYTLQASGGAKITAYCSRLEYAAASVWNRESRRGIRPGMPLAEATALALRSSASAPHDETAPRLHLEAADAAADFAALETLADQAQRFAPAVGIDDTPPIDSLLLDITGVGAISGGESALARRIVADFASRRLHARVALADTPGAAWAAAHFMPLTKIDESSTAAEILAALAEPLHIAAGENALAPLPPAALRLPDETCRLLAELGIGRVEQLAALPRDTLRARFGPQVLLRLDQALGTAAEAIAARSVPTEWSFEWRFEHPTGRREMIEWTIGELVARMCRALARERRGVLRLVCRLLPERGRAVELMVGLYRPSASERHVGELLRLKLEPLRFRQPLSAIRLEVRAFDRLEFQQQEMFAGLPGQGSEAPRALAALVDRLGNRLGAQAVVRPWLLAGAQPEFACQYVPVASLNPRRARGSQPCTQPGDRPLWLEAAPQSLAVLSVVPEGPPVRFRQDGHDQRVVRHWGPERIETGWWRGHCIRRDYYQVETDRGQRYWLFRELNSGRWFLHGEFG